MSRRTLPLMAAVVVLAAATACIPPPALALLTVTTANDGTDADPGDGVCEMTVGAGDCSLRAAVGEANALGGAQISLPTGDYELTVADADGDIDLDVTAPIELTGTDDPRLGLGAPWTLDVATGARLSAEGLTTGPVRTAGLVVLDQVWVGQIGATGTALQVAPSGVAVVANSQLSGGGPLVDNDGEVTILYTTMKGYASSILATGDGATTRLGASVVLNFQFFGIGTLVALKSLTHCTGDPIESLGHNYVGGTDCALGGSGDLDGDDVAGFGPLGSTWPVGPFDDTPSNAPSVDLVSPGALGCGTSVIADFDGTARPLGASCDAGADEVA